MSAFLLALSGNAASKDPTAHDPGVRSGNAGAGGPLPGISAAYNNLFVAGLATFSQVEQVMQDGLGPRMNLNNCAGWRAAPATGGSGPKSNPEFSFVNGADHGNNTLPSFITKDGPTREARFKKTNPGNTTDGGVHNLFTISGMKGAESSKRPAISPTAATENHSSDSFSRFHHRRGNASALRQLNAAALQDTIQ